MNAQQVSKIKSQLPFDEWVGRGQEFGMEQYTPEACAKFTSIFNRLLEKLSAMGDSAAEPMKIEAFKEAVEALNSLNEEDSSLIETGEREELCELCNVIAAAAGIDPSKYGGGEGPASEWRDW